jgi:hypothetical protein
MTATLPSLAKLNPNPAWALLPLSKAWPRQTNHPRWGFRLAAIRPPPGAGQGQIAAGRPGK